MFVYSHFANLKYRFNQHPLYVEHIARIWSHPDQYLITRFVVCLLFLVGVLSPDGRCPRFSYINHRPLSTRY